jgi:hypothetical protein
LKNQHADEASPCCAWLRPGRWKCSRTRGCTCAANAHWQLGQWKVQKCCRIYPHVMMLSANHQMSLFVHLYE